MSLFILLLPYILLIIFLILLYVNRKFLKDSVRELKHVVWPTREETKNYFVTVTIVLFLFGLYLFIADTVFTSSLFGLQKMVKGEKTEKSIDISDTKQIDLEKFIKENKTELKVGNVKVDAKKVKPTIEVEATKEAKTKIDAIKTEVIDTEVKKEINVETKAKKEIKADVKIDETGTGVSQ